MEFDGLYAATRVPARRVALNATNGDPWAADDVLARASEHLWLAMERGLAVDDAEHFLALLCKGIGWSAVWHRKRWWRESVTDDGEVPTGTMAPVPSPEDELLGWYGNDAYTALAALPPRGRALLWCRHYAGMDDHGAGAVLGLTARSVNGSRGKAMRQLRAAHATVTAERPATQ